MDTKELISRLSFVEANVLEEAAQQPALFYEVSKARVERMRRRSQATAEYESHKVALSMKYRASAKDFGERITEKSLEQRVESRRTTKEFRAAVESAEADEELSKLLLEAWRMRRDAIRILAEARVYQGVNEDAETTRLQRKLADKARKLEERRSALTE
jgi:hypothetical protein